MRTFTIYLVVGVLVLVCSVITLAQPLTGTKTIGGTTPDYATFTSAITALTTNGVGTGGVTFQVRPGTYNEMVVINAITGASATNPIIFQKQGGTVTLSPTATAAEDAAVKLNGCRYVTFDGINVVDSSRGTSFLDYGYWITNASLTAGAQYNTIINCSIRLRIDTVTIGVNQKYSIMSPPTAFSGSQSFNRYLNLKISKCRTGIQVYAVDHSTYPDSCIEIGSTSSNTNDTNRLVIGAMANDTIGGPGYSRGIFAAYINGLTIHDIDVKRVIATSFRAWGIEVYYSSVNVNNNRISDISANGTSGALDVYGIWQYTPNNSPCKYYNNMIWGIRANVAAPTNTLYAAGFVANGGNFTLDNNTFFIDQGTGSGLNYSSTAIYTSAGIDTVRNNIIANFTANQTGSSCHYGFYNSGGDTIYSNYNCFYIPNTANGYVGYYTVNRADLAAWRTSATNLDVNSVSGDPQFLSTTSPVNLHIRLNQTASIIESRGIPISYVTTDIDSEARSTTTPDIGADEGNFTGPAPLTGTKTIGGTNPDYPTFAGAITALTTFGVGTGGVTFNVRSGTYNEMVIVNAINGASSTNPVTFRKQDGTVTISPATTASVESGVKLNGCSYVTFDGINVVDASTGTDFLEYGYWVTNFSATQGAQYNTIQNCSITLRVVNGSMGIFQSHSVTPTAASGAQSYNRYINLKISKCFYGGKLYSRINFPDIGNEVGSTSSNVNDTNRFVVGALPNDTIGGTGPVVGITAYYQTGLTIHDIDIRNVKSTTGTVWGIENYVNTGGINRIYNNRIYNLSTAGTTSYYNVYGIANMNSQTNATCRYYNNMVWGLQATSILIPASSTIYMTGLQSYGGNCNFDNNTIMIDQGTGSSLRCSSAAIMLNDTNSTDTLRNNIVANITGNQTGTSYHYGVYVTGNTTGQLYSNNNCFYIPNTTNGFVGYWNGNRSDLAAWQGASNKDSNSVSGDPQFISATAPVNLHIQLNRPTSIIESRGIRISYVTTDIDSEARSAITPDIGSDEGTFTLVSVQNGSKEIPTVFSLAPAYPNPFNATTTIRFSLPVASLTKLELFDINGRHVTTLQNNLMSAGSHRIQFDGSRLASGMYFIRMNAGSFTAQQKIILIK